MKKLITIIWLTCCINLHAQEIGIRLGSFNNSSIAIDGIVNFEDHTRLHGDITFGQGIGANLLYNFKVDTLYLAKTQFQYYFGVGLGTFIGDPFILGVNGETGVEYLFNKTPITLGVDWRPQVNIITNTSLEILQFAINIRYRINEL